MGKYLVIFPIVIIFSVYNIFDHYELSVLNYKYETGTVQVHSTKTHRRQSSCTTVSKNADSTTVNVTSISKLWSSINGKRFYLNHTAVAIIPEVSYTVLRKLLFLWIQSPLPKKYFRNVLSYHRNNPEYQINLWLDQNTLENKLISERIKIFGNTSDRRIIIRDVDEIRMENYDIFEAEKNVGSKADILRLELVYQEGGIYSDIDSVSMRSFDAFFRHSFVTYTLGIWNSISNACFGFPRNSNFLHFVLMSLRANYHAKDIVLHKTGPVFFNTCFINYNDNNISMIASTCLIDKSEDGYTYHTNDATWMYKIG